MTKWIIGAVIIIVVVAAGVWYYTSKLSPQAPQTTTGEQATTTSPSMLTYASSTLGVSFQYPSDWTVDETYAYNQFPNKPIHGVKVTIPETMATGTNLSGNDTGFSVEQLPHAKNCTADIFLPENVKAASMTIGSSTYSFASTTGAGAGNFYEEDVYAISNSKPCTAVRYFIHSTNIGNYPPGTVTAFDQAALMNDLDSIRNSLTLTSAAQ